MDLQQAQDLFKQAVEAYKNNDLELAIQLWSQIEKTSDELQAIYANAQFNLGVLFSQKNNIEKAKEAFNSVYKEKITDSFYKNKKAKAGICLIDLHLREINQNKTNIEQTIKTFTQVLEDFPKDTEEYLEKKYHIDLIFKILKHIAAEKVFSYLEMIGEIEYIFEKLRLSDKYEKLVAHYTRLDIAKLLLSNKDNGKGNEFKAQSLFRLGVTSLMNDPTEGCLLNELMCLDKKIQTQDLAFITCFTLHHNSLNQFRLYGKNSQQEATGLSLVLSKDFFTSEHNINLFFKNNIDPILEQNFEYKTQKKSLPNMPLYRCIYLDPKSGLIKVAQREEWSFYREYKAENKQHIIDENPEAEKNWKEYQDEILEIESEVKTHLKELVEHVKLLNPQSLNDEEKELLAEILLPLRYLIKHMAFKEEQECRMIYVTQMDNPLIKYDEKINRIYIDYEPSVMEHLEKIYLAPKAKGEKMVFEYLCSRGQAVRKDKDKAYVKVKISQNPFQ